MFFKKSGSCGMLSWTLNRDGILTISGTGPMREQCYPWDKYKEHIHIIHIQEGVTSISSGAFRDCRRLATVKVAGNVTDIGKDAFWFCSNLTTITLSKHVASIGAGAFKGCRSMSTITLPNSVTDIGRGAFADCTGLTNIIIPGGVAYIRERTFDGCTGLRDITIPDSVMSIGERAFLKCNSLINVRYSGTKKQWEAIEFNRHNDLLLGKKILCADGETDQAAIREALAVAERAEKSREAAAKKAAAEKAAEKAAALRAAAIQRIARKAAEEKAARQAASQAAAEKALEKATAEKAAARKAARLAAAAEKAAADRLATGQRLAEEKQAAEKRTELERMLPSMDDGGSALLLEILTSDPKQLQNAIRHADAQEQDKLIKALDDSMEHADAENLEILQAVRDFTKAQRQSGAEDLTDVDFQSIPKVYITYVLGLQKLWPAIDLNGYMHAFSDQTEAAAQAESNGFALLDMTGAEFQKQLPAWRRVGIVGVRFHQNGRLQEIQLPGEPAYNGDLQGLMIRFLQAEQGKTDLHRQTAATWWSFLCHQLPERLFFVPMCYEGENINVPVNDSTLRLFPGAAKIIMKHRSEGNIELFDGYPFANKADGRTMHFRALKNGATGQEALAAFTDPHEYETIWKGLSHPALATFDDMKNMYQPTIGILINPSSQCLLLEPAQIRQIEQERNQPIRFYMQGN